MIQFNKKLLSLAAVAMLVAGITGCQKNNPAGSEPADTPAQSQPSN